MTEISRDILRNTVSLIATRVLTGVMGIFSVSIAARYLGPGDFGILEYSLTFVGFFLFATDLGTRTVLVRRLSLQSNHEAQLIADVWGLRMIFAAFALPLPYLLARWLGLETLVTNGILLATLLIPIAGLDTPSAIFQARRRMEWSSVGPIVQSVFYLLVCVYAAKMGWGIHLWIMGYVLTAGLGTMGALLASRKFLFVLPRFSPRRWPALIAESWPIGLSVSVLLLTWRLDIILLERIHGSLEVVGQYAFARRFIEIGVLVCGALVATLLPWFSRMRVDLPDGGTAAVQKTLRKMFLLSAAMTLLCLAGSPLLEWFGGTRFRASGPLFGVLACIFPFYFAEATMGTALIAAGRARWAVAANGAGLVTSICLNLMLIPMWGPLGAAFATVTAQAVECSVIYKLFQKEYGPRARSSK